VTASTKRKRRIPCLRTVDEAGKPYHPMVPAALNLTRLMTLILVATESRGLEYRRKPILFFHRTTSSCIPQNIAARSIHVLPKNPLRHIANLLAIMFQNLNTSIPNSPPVRDPHPPTHLNRHSAALRRIDLQAQASSLPIELRLRWSVLPGKVTVLPQLPRPRQP
jgi:hypothetical protein